MKMRQVFENSSEAPKSSILYKTAQNQPECIFQVRRDNRKANHSEIQWEVKRMDQSRVMRGHKQAGRDARPENQ